MAATAAAAVAALFLGASLFGHNVALRLMLLAAGLVLAGALAVRGRPRLALLPPVWIPFALCAAWAAASLVWSVEPERTLKEWRNEVFYTGCALWMCFVAAQARNAARIIAPVLGLAALAVCAVALWDYSQGLRQYRAGWHGGPGDHSSALLALMPCAVMTGWYVRRLGGAWWIVAASWALAALFFVSAYTTHNRTVWLGFAAQFVVLGTFLALRGRAQAAPSTARRVRIAAGVIAVVAASGALFVAATAEKEAVRNARGTTLAEHRVALWPEIAERIAERPLTGHGFGRGLLRQSLQEELGDVSRNLWHAHNLLLDTMLQTGLAGLTLFLLLLGTIAFQAWRAARSADDGLAACGMVLGALLAGMLVRNMTDTLLARQNALLFWGLVGVLLAWGGRPWRA
jgi:O-antigen ligase